MQVNESGSGKSDYGIPELSYSDERFFHTLRETEITRIAFTP